MNGGQRRQYERVPFWTALTVIDQSSQKRYSGHSIDLSLNGMRLYAERFFDVGSWIGIVAERGGAGQGPPAPILATVRWASVEAEGAVLGVEFGSVLDPRNHPELYEALCSA